LGLVALSVALVIIVSTDRGAPWATRAGTLAAAAPVCGAIGAFGAAALARQRGEQRALEAMGLGRWGAARGAVLGGLVWGLLGAASVPFADLSGVYPPASTSMWSVQADGSLYDPVHGATVHPDGTLARSPRVPRAPPSRTLWTAVGLGFLAVTLCFWAVSEQSLGRRMLVAGITAAALLAALAWLAARSTTGALWLLPGLAPLAQVALSWLAERRRGQVAVTRGR
jgi:hypothetical protein